MEPQDLVFYLGIFVAPALLVFFSFAVRKARGWYYTAGSDFLFTLMTISFSCAILVKDVAPHIANSDLREASAAVFIVLGLLIMLGWYWAVSSVEVQINQAIQAGIPAQAMLQAKIFFSWTFAVTFFALEVMIFLYR